jgi:yecA family protein
VLSPTYQQIQQLLAQERSLADAAEAHGTLAGCLCGASDYRFEDWLREILPEGRAGAAASATLQELYTATATALLQPDMEFELLLPEDEEPIDVRTAALAQWCQGFLYGLGTGSIPDASKLPGDVGEVVRDFVEITRAGVDGDQDPEANESAYAELVEFVRVGVQLLFEELGGARRAVPPTSTPLH